MKVNYYRKILSAVKKLILSFVAALLLGLPAMAQNEVVGVWLTEDESTKVEIYQQENGQYYGKVVWLKEPEDSKGNPHTDKKNPDKALRSRTIMGMDMLEGMDYSSGQWKGTIYAPKKGRTGDVTLSLNNPNELRLKVKVYGFTRELTWTKASL